MMLLALLLAQAAAGVPTKGAATIPAGAAALGARLARSGSIMALLPLVAQKDTEELVAAHPELSAQEKQKLRDTARATLAQGMKRIEMAFGAAYAKRFTVAELTRLVVQAEAPEQRRLRAAQPAVMAEAIGSLGSLDLKRDVAAAFCRETGKLCTS